MTDIELFDLWAPIYIYHKADVKYRPQAIKAFKKLRSAGLVEGVVQNVHNDPALVDKCIDEYVRLYQGFVAERGWAWDYDQWGAIRVRDERGRRVTSGDGMYMPTLYLSYAALKQSWDSPIRENG